MGVGWGLGGGKRVGGGVGVEEGWGEDGNGGRMEGEMEGAGCGRGRGGWEMEGEADWFGCQHAHLTRRGPKWADFPISPSIQAALTRQGRPAPRWTSSIFAADNGVTCF